MNQENMWWIIDLAMRARVFQYFPRPGWRASVNVPGAARVAVVFAAGKD
jgi:hypothetical protein